MFAPQSQPVPWLAIKTLRPFYLLHMLKRNKSDCYLPTTDKKLMYLRASGKRIIEKYRPEMLALIKKAYSHCKTHKKVLMVPLVIRPAQKEGLQPNGHENMLIFNTI